MIIIGSAILFALGMALLLWQAIVIVYRLIKIAVLLVAWCGCVLALVVTGCAWLGVKLFKLEPDEPVVTINIFDDDDAHTIELPRQSFRRLRD
jgi:hypothetical protein